jgi:hypothetical protein
MKGLGWVKMRGKKCKVLNCGCCVAENRRDDIIWNEAANEISYVTSGQDERDYWYDLMMRDAESTFAEEMAAFNIEPVVDEFTIAKYTWGQGMSDPRILAILAQQHADFLMRVADRWDAQVAEAA